MKQLFVLTCEEYYDKHGLIRGGKNYYNYITCNIPDVAYTFKFDDYFNYFGNVVKENNIDKSLVVGFGIVDFEEETLENARYKFNRIFGD